MADSGAKRQSSTSSHRREGPRDPLPISNPNIFSDDFALEPLEVSDQSTPSMIAGDDISPISTVSLSPRLPGPSHSAVSPRELPSRNRSSSGYGGSDRSSFRTERFSQNYVPSVGSVSDPRKTTSIPHRSISAISNFSMPRTQSPYQGATGPSHPYGMYPQDIGLARNPSSATNSMARVPEASYAGPDGPTQPYGMYSQNTLPEDEADRNADVIRAIPGFPGREQNFQRRFGQDGEDAADLVGPDGYMEQLPPYTRYANNIPPKVGTTGPEIAGDVSRNLPADSQDTLNTAQSRDFAAGALIRDGNPTQPNSSPSGASAPSDGGHFKERCKERGKKKVCFGRIPMWLVMIILLILAVLIGAVIGGVLGHVDKEASEDNAPTPSSPNFAA